MIHEVFPPLGIPKVDQIEARIAYGLRRTDDGDKYPNGIKVEVIYDVVQNMRGIQERRRGAR